MPASLEMLPTVYPMIWVQSGFCFWHVLSLASVSLSTSHQAELRFLANCDISYKLSYKTEADRMEGLSPAPSEERHAFIRQARQ